MNLRHFLASLLSLLAAPFVRRKEEPVTTCFFLEPGKKYWFVSTPKGSQCYQCVSMEEVHGRDVKP